MTEGPERFDLEQPESETEEIDAVLVGVEEGLPTSMTEASRGEFGALPFPRRGARALAVSLGKTPAAQAAAVAAGGFLAGAALASLRRRRGTLARTRRASGGRQLLHRRRVGGRGPGELLQIVGTHSLLLDVHLLGPAGRGR